MVSLPSEFSYSGLHVRTQAHKHSLHSKSKYILVPFNSTLLIGPVRIVGLVQSIISSSGLPLTPLSHFNTLNY